MKIVTYADSHFGYSGDFSYQSSSGYSTRLDHSLKLHRWISRKVEEIRPDIVVNLGDIFKSQVNIEGYALSAASKGIGAIAQAAEGVGAEHLVILGNHDYVSHDRRVSSVDWVDYLPSTRLHTEIDWWETGEYFTMGVVPYYQDWDFVIRKLKEIKDEEPDDIDDQGTVLFGHMDISGAIQSVSGYEDPYLHENEHESVPPGLLKEFRYVFNGHHHIPQRPTDNVILTGSIQQFTVTEREHNYPRGIHVLDTENWEVDVIPNTVTPGIIKIKDDPSLVEEINSNNYVIFEYNPRELDFDEHRHKFQKFEGFRQQKKDPEKFRPQKGVEFESQDQDYEGTYREYLETVDTEASKERLEEEGIKTIREARDQDE